MTHVDCDETLPSESDAEVVSLPSDEESSGLPSPVSSAHDAPVEESQELSCCHAGCIGTIEESRSLTARSAEIASAMKGTSQGQRELLQFHCLRAWRGQTSTGWRQYVFGGVPLCVRAVCSILKLTQWKFKAFSKQIAEGKLAPDASLKHHQIQKEKAAMIKANVLLQWLHENVAESLAETKNNDQRVADGLTFMSKAASAAGLAKDKLPVSTQCNGLFSEYQENGQQVKWLPPGTTMTDMKDLAQTFLPDQTVSYTTFVVCYQKEWQARLKIRAEGQHSKCATCSRLKEFRRQCTSPGDVDKVQQEYQQHIAAVMADRKFDAQLNLKAQQSVGSVPGYLAPAVALLSISMDAMDCAKFKVPRHLEASKEFQNAWRPEMTMLAAIVEGLTEHYVLVDQDITKNADLQSTILGLALQESIDMLKARGKELPRHLRVHTDNASGEGKNQTMFYLSSWMLRRKLFDSVTLSQFRVGHSHGKPDQRFSEVRWALSQSPVLESPDQFAETIRQSVKPREGRTLKVHKVGASLEFKHYFEELALKTSGHTQTKGKTEQRMEACHVFSFCRRETMAEKVVGNIQEWAGKATLAPDPNDIILTVQHHLASPDDSQPPQVFAAAADFDKLPPAETIPISPRSQFSEKQRKEFEKTAWKITQPPWNLNVGSAYLLKLVTENFEGSGLEWTAPAMPFLLTGTREATVACPQPEDSFSDQTFAWCHSTPAPVCVTRLRKKTSAWTQPSERPAASAMAGAPASLYGRDGAPDRVAAEPPKKKAKKTWKRPAAAAAARAPAAATPAPDKEPCAPTPSEPLPSDVESEILPPQPAQQQEQSACTANGPAAESIPTPDAAPKAKAKAKGKAKAKAKATAEGQKAQTGKRPQYGRLPKPAGVSLGCSKCKYQGGCARCREMAGLVLNEDKTAWVYRKEQQG